MDFIYLIKPVWFGADIVYKLILKDEKLYFCKVGGQFYHISDIDKKYSGLSNEEELIEDSKNSMHLCQDIQYVHIDNKRSWWTGHVMNNGTVTLIFEGKKEKYIIHGYQDAKKVEQFFKQIPGVWVEMRDRFLDSVQKFMLSQEFDQDSYCYTKEYRRASIIIKGLNTLIFLSVLGILFATQYKQVLLATFLILPLISLGIYAHYNKFVSFAGSRVGATLNIGWVGVPIAIVFMYAMTMNIIYSAYLWILTVILTTIIVGILLKVTKEYKTEKGISLVIAFFVGFYVYGALITSNVALDYSQPMFFSTKVIAKDMSSSAKGGTSYNLTIDGFQSVAKGKEVEVSKQDYEFINVGDTVAVIYSKGFWGIPWFEVSR